MHTPGHTPACMTYVVERGATSAAFVGDTLFMPDYGTARCDFPGGDARTLFRSIHKVLSLPPETRLFMCHDYQPGGREVQFVSTVAEEREQNIHVRDGISEEEFVAMRAGARRDAGHADADPAVGAGEHARRASCRSPRPTARATSRSP